MNIFAVSHHRATRRVGLALLLVVAIAVTAVTAIDGGRRAAADPAVPALEQLVVDPLPGGGVEGFVQMSVPQNWRVHTFAQIGDRLFVGGAFTTVSELPYAGSPTHAQPFVAAFDLDTNAFIDTWRPTFDDVVWSLESYGGNLIVGGEFDTVNGVAREGLVTLDPQTGAIVAGFGATIANDGSSYEPSVRALKIVGDDLYVVGDYNRIVEGGWRHGRYRTARLDAATGHIDSAWIPQVSGGGVFDVAVDTTNAKVYLVGSFTSVGAQPSTRTGAVVSPVDGTVLANHPFSLNGNWSRTYGVDFAGNHVFIGGEQHYVQVRDRVTWAFVGCMATGYTSLDQTTCTGSWAGGNGFGGDYQVVEAVDGYVLGGCHCRGDHWNSIIQQEVDLDDRGFRIYRPDGTEVDFMPNATNWNEGPYAAFFDSNECLYIGGDFTGAVDGFARYCGVVSAPTALTGAAVGIGISLSWDEPLDVGSGIAEYEVWRDGAFLGSTASTTYNDTTVATDTTYSYTVRASSTTGVDGPESDPVLVTSNGDDVTPPSVPPNVQLSTDGVSEVTVSWDAATDDVGVVGYLVHRDWQYLGYVTSLSFVDDTVVAGQTYRYQVRAKDAAGNTSSPSPIQSIFVGTPDVTPPSVPPNVQLSTDGVSEVTVSWDAATDDVGVVGYLVHRDWQYLGYVTSLSFVDDTVVAGQTYRYQVRAKDAAGNTSSPSPIQSIFVGTPDVTPPSVPPNVQLSTDGVSEVTVSWDAATDDVGVVGYLVHRDWQYLGYVTSLSFVDDTVVAGQTYRYQVRAKDAAGNTSSPSPIQSITVE